MLMLMMLRLLLTLESKVRDTRIPCTGLDLADQVVDQPLVPRALEVHDEELAVDAVKLDGHVDVDRLVGRVPVSVFVFVVAGVRRRVRVAGYGVGARWLLAARGLRVLVQAGVACVRRAAASGGRGVRVEVCAGGVRRGRVCDARGEHAVFSEARVDDPWILGDLVTPIAVSLIKRMLSVNPVHRITIEDIREDPWFLKDLPAYLALPRQEFFDTGVDPNKAIDPKSLAPSQPPAVAEKLHEVVVGKLGKTMGYSKHDVQEALAHDEPSAIKDAYLIVRENQIMKENRKSRPLPPTMIMTDNLKLF